MRNIVLTRIDDRLIHGQVVSGWIPHVHANTIIIVDDEIAKNKLMARVLAASLEDTIRLKIYSVESAAKALQKAPVSSKERILLMTKSPIPILKLVKLGCDISCVNLGGMGMHGDRQPFFRNISCTEEEKEALVALKEKGIDIFYQLVPEQVRFESTSFIK